MANYENKKTFFRIISNKKRFITSYHAKKVLEPIFNKESYLNK